MPVEPALNTILKEMWRLQEKMDAGALMSESEQEFYNQNLNRIQEYYRDNETYWASKTKI